MLNRRNFLKRTANALAGTAAVIVGAPLPQRVGGYVKDEVPELSTGEAEVPASFARRSPFIFEPWGISHSLQKATNAEVAAMFATELTKKVESGEVKPIAVGEHTALFLEMLE